MKTTTIREATRCIYYILSIVAIIIVAKTLVEITVVKTLLSIGFTAYKAELNATFCGAVSQGIVAATFIYVAHNVNKEA